MNDLNNRPLRVMVIDDESDVTFIICDYLKSEGFDVAGFSDSTSALRELMSCEIPPDVILLDIMMPQIDGYEFCRRLREEPRLQNVPVVFLTGKDRVDDSLGFLKSGGQLYVKKPFQLSELKDVALLCATGGLPTW
jgi:DNA-binding response OmpR family regulator